jgi:hypothetical protein
MKSKHMHVRVVLSSLLAVLALSAVVASAAQAATPEGPFYKITGARLLSGASKEVKVKSSSGIILNLPEEGVKLECSKQGLAAGAKLLGSTGANFGSGEGSLEFSECFLAEGNGSPNCQPTSSTIKTDPLKWKLAYTDAARTGDVAVVFEPVSGSNIADVHFTGSNCTISELPLYGSFAGDVEVGRKLVEVSKEPAATKTLEIRFPAAVIREAWPETGGVLKDTKVKLLAYGDALTYTGSLELEAGGAEWGVFT